LFKMWQDFVGPTSGKCSRHHENCRRLGAYCKTFPATGEIGQVYAQSTGSWQSLLMVYISW
jgi:hypothetical protein